MIPYAHPVPRKTSDNTPSISGGDPATDRIRHNEQKMQLENRIRILKNEVLSKKRIQQDIERDVHALEMSLHHVEEESTRIGGEYKRMESDVRTIEGDSKKAELGFREKDIELHRKQEELRKIEHEISLLRAQITEKERIIVFVKQDVSKLMKEKEDFRREHELEHFTVKTEIEHAHEKSVRVQILAQDRKRKENEIVRKQQMISEVKRSLIEKEQDVMQLEAQLRRMVSGM